MQPSHLVYMELRRSAYHQRGLTLIEFMVSITIGLILLTALVALMARQSTTQLELEKSSRQIENGRYAIQLLQEDVQLAGYTGEYGGGFTAPGTLPNPCVATASGLIDSLELAVQGYDSPTTLPTTIGTGCSLNAANYVPGTDILVVRHVEPSPTPSGDLKEGAFYLQAGITDSKAFSYVLAQTKDDDIDTATFNLKKKDGTAAPMRRLLVHIYFISPCSVPKSGDTCTTDNTDDGGVSIPTLKRIELSYNESSASAQFKTVPLVEGIENMQLEYGKDVDDGDGAPDSYVAKPGDAEWPNVMAVRVHLLARNNERTAGYVDNKTYQLGSVTVNPVDKTFKRRVFSQVIRVVNPSARRERG